MHGVTPVYIANWVAIHKRNPDGSRKYKYIINTGSSRSSKTYSLIDVADEYSRKYKNKRGTIWRDTKTDCKKTVLNDILKHHKNTSRYQNNYFFNKTESIFFYETQSTTEIHGTDDEETVHGLTQDWAWLNEPYKISRETFDQIDQRTSDFIFIDWNPKKDHWIDILSKQKNAIVIHSTYKDNPFCPEEQKKKIESYQTVSQSEAVKEKLIHQTEVFTYDFELNSKKLSKTQIQELKRCLYNEETQTANKYNWEVYGLGLKSERPNRIFHWHEIKYSEYLKIDKPTYYGVDWGVVDPMGIIEVKYYDRALYIHELNYKSENQLKADLTPTQKAQIDKNTQEGFIMWVFRLLGIDMSRPVICDNNRPMKIIALRKSGFDYAVATSKGKGSIIDGIDNLNNLKVYYTHTSTNVKYEQENYSRKVDKRTGEVLEEPEDSNNHLIDPSRYVLSFLIKNEIINII